MTSSWNHSGYPELLRIYLPTSIYASAVEEIFDCDGSAAPLLRKFAVVDPLLEQFAIAINASLQNRDSEPLYIDSIAHFMASHLALRHSSRSLPIHPVPVSKLAGPKLQRVIEYVEANISTDLTVHAMAAEAEMSLIYFPRVFKATFGKLPHQYVVERRVEHTKELLQDMNLPLLDIASAVGFYSPSHF